MEWKTNNTFNNVKMEITGQITGDCVWNKYSKNNLFIRLCWLFSYKDPLSSSSNTGDDSCETQEVGWTKIPWRLPMVSSAKCPKCKNVNVNSQQWPCSVCFIIMDNWGAERDCQFWLSIKPVDDHSYTSTRAHKT